VTTRSARRHALPLALGGAAMLLALTACSSSDDKSADTATPSNAGTTSTSASASPQISGSITVFAASSLKESFTELGKQFETAYPGTKVTFDFAGSDTLAASITSGAPADVFAAASPTTMKTVTDAGDGQGTPSTFVRNRLEIATLPGNPDHIATLKDLTRSGLKVALCAKTVPCGSAAQKALTASKLSLTPVSYEQDVKSALTKVELKEVDAAVVYQTDVKAAAGKVDGVQFPESAGAVNAYPIVALKDAPNKTAAQAFIALVKSAEGQKVLTGAGFLNPCRTTPPPPRAAVGPLPSAARAAVRAPAAGYPSRWCCTR
jgi:molybdate transport system substrate-binding protein